MIDDISVDYGGGGPVSILQGGKPAAVSLSVSFTEMDIETAGDYSGGLEPPTVTGTNTEGATTAQGTATTETTPPAPAGSGPSF